jgi:hypothetical protein
VLLYATGGLAYGEVKSSETIGLAPVGFSNTDTRFSMSISAGRPDRS